MNNRHLLSLTAYLCLASAAPSTWAADDADLRALRQELTRLQESYEKRITALEQRLIQAENKATAAQQNAPSSVLPTQAAPASTNAFNPDISLILSGMYSNLSKNPSTVRITGFALPTSSLSEMTPQRGFGLAESELGISANIDHYFRGALNFAIAPDNTVSAEEAYVQTTALPSGLTLKAGRYLSGVGYHNAQHAHTWDFVDAPLAYQALLGGKYSQDGLQLRWLAPTNTYLEIGAELGNGANFPGTSRNKNGAGASALFAHLGGDVGTSHNWRAGISLLNTSAQNREWDDVDALGTNVTNHFTGRSKVWVIDGVWKWAPNGNATSTSFKLQGEYLRRTESGSMVYDVNAASSGTLASSYASAQSGWYLQGVYQFAPAWRAALRTEQLDAGSVNYGINNASLLRPNYKPSRQALMLDYSPSEFSRIRLQLAQDKSHQGMSSTQLFLQYQMSLGAHGAHAY